MEEQMRRVLLAYWTQLTVVSLFRSLGQTLLTSGDNFPAVEWKFRRARGKWGWMAKILGRERADRIMVGRFYMAVVQSVLLFGSATWVMTPQLENP